MAFQGKENGHLKFKTLHSLIISIVYINKAVVVIVALLSLVDFEISGMSDSSALKGLQ